MPAKGAEIVPRALTIATSDWGGGAGIQADLKAFAAAGVLRQSVLVALTAQNTTAVTAIHELPPDFVVAQLDAVFDGHRRRRGQDRDALLADGRSRRSPSTSRRIPCRSSSTR